MPVPGGTGKAFQYVLIDRGTADERWEAVEGQRFNDDDVPQTQQGLFVGAAQYQFDERTARFVRMRVNRGGLSLLASAARTVTTNSTTQTNRNWRGVHITINVTVHGGGLGIVPHIQGNDPITGNFYDLLIGTTIAATGFVVIKVYPGIGQIVGGAASDFLPYNWRFQMEALDATSHTYQVTAQLDI